MEKASAWFFTLDKQEVRCALLLAVDKAGSSIAARMAMTAMTTSNSISVNATPRHWGRLSPRDCFLRVIVSAPCAYRECLAELGLIMVAARLHGQAVVLPAAPFNAEPLSAGTRKFVCSPISRSNLALLKPSIHLLIR